MALLIALAAATLLPGAALACAPAPSCCYDAAAITDNTTGIKVVDTIAGTSLKLIQSALPEFTRRGLNNLDGYRIIIVVRDNGRHVVIFRDLNAPPGFGNAGEKPSLEVEFDEDVMIRSYSPR